MKIPTILDVDTGIDDGIAIMLCFLSQKLDIKFICTCFGNTTAENSAKNTANLLTELNIPLPQIAIGSKAPIKIKRPRVNVHGLDGFGDYKFANHEFKFTKQGYLKAYADAILSSPRKVTIIVLGPLTNLAKVVERHPEVKQNIDKVLFMGSSLKQYHDNQIPYAGFNVACDPEALKIVMNLGLQVVFCPNDIGKKAHLTPNQITKMSKINKVGKMFVSMFKNYRDRQKVNGVAMYDSTAVYAILQPKNVKISPVKITLKYYKELETGVALAEFKKPFNAKMVTKINARKFKKYFFDVLKNYDTQVEL